MHLVKHSKEEREYAVGNEAQCGFVPWVDESMLPSYLHPDVFDFLIREGASSEQAQLLIAMRMIHHLVFGKGETLTVRPIDKSRRFWRAIVQLRAHYRAHPLSSQQRVELEQVMCSKLLITLCGNDEAANRGEKRLGKSLLEVFQHLKKEGQQSIGDHAGLLKRVIGAARVRREGRSALAACTDFSQFFPYFISSSLDREILDFIISQHPNVYHLLPMRAAYLYVFDDTLKTVRERPDFLQETTWEEIQQLRNKYQEMPLQQGEKLAALMNGPEIVEIFKRDENRREEIIQSLDPEIKIALHELRNAGGNELSTQRNSLLTYAGTIEQGAREMRERRAPHRPMRNERIVAIEEAHLWSEGNPFNRDDV